MTDIGLISALRDETQGLFDDILPVVYSGVGKVNAALTAAKVIEQYNPKLIINFGTAGSHAVEPHTLVDCNKFIQRDMHVKELGFDFAVTPFEEDVPTVLEFSSYGSMNMTCGTGDNFVASSDELGCDVVDMEAYAIAKACHLAGVDFMSYKYITDGAGEDAAAQWTENCKKGAAKFLEVLAEASMSAQFFAEE